MTKQLTFLAVVAMAFVFFTSSPAKADPIQVTLTGVSGGVQGNVDTSPYFGTVGSLTNVAIICDDFVHEVYVSESWTATVSTFANLSGVRFQQGTAALTLLKYEEAGWLVDQLFADPADGGNISYAIWALFEPSATEASSGWTSDAATWLAEAQAPLLTSTFTTAEFSNLEILTPTNSGPDSAQEYFAVVSTPEASTMLLLAAGLLGLLTLAAWKSRAAKMNPFAAVCARS